MALQVEVKMKKKKESNNKGRGWWKYSRGGYRGGSSKRGNENRGQGDSKSVEQTHESNNSGVYGRGNFFVVVEEEDQVDLEEALIFLQWSVIIVGNWITMLIGFLISHHIHKER